MSGRNLASLLLLALLAGCSAGGNVSGGSGPAGPAGSSVPELEASEGPGTSQDTEPSAAALSFSDLPDTFSFSSEDGAWGMELTLGDDGSVQGMCRDTFAEDVGAEYPNGTEYRCQLQGKFSPPEQVNAYTWSTHVEDLKLVGTPGAITYEGGVRYIDFEPYGLEDADEVLIYLPGTPLADLPEGQFPWLDPARHVSSGTLSVYGLYNVNEEQGFVGVLA